MKNVIYLNDLCIFTLYVDRPVSASGVSKDGRTLLYCEEQGSPRNRRTSEDRVLLSYHIR